MTAFQKQINKQSKYETNRIPKIASIPTRDVRVRIYFRIRVRPWTKEHKTKAKWTEAKL